MAGFCLNWRELKEKGNKALGNGDYRGATDCYNCAINLAENYGAGIQDVASLYSNRSLSLSKLGFFPPALQDALHCIDLNRNWCKGYWRAGQALKSMGLQAEALQAFSDGCIFVNEDVGKNWSTKVEFIVEIVSLSHETGSWEHLAKYVRARDSVWSEVLLVIAKRKKWETLSVLLMGTGVFRKQSVMNNYGEKFPRINTKKICITNLVRFCADQADSRFVQLVIILLKHGSKVVDITLETGDTPFHAALKIAIRTSKCELLWYLIEANPVAVKKLQDARGDTLLHKMAKTLARTQSLLFGDTMYQLLKKVDPCILNKEGKLAIDYLPKENGLYKELEKTMKGNTSDGVGAKSKQSGKISTGSTKKEQKSHGPQSAQAQPRYAEGARPKEKPTAHEHQVDEGWDGISKMQTAENLFHRGKQFLSRLKFEEALESYCKFLEENHDASIVHKGMISEALDIVVDRIVPTFKEIPSRIVCKLPEDIWTSVIVKLAKNKKWSLVQKLILGGGNGFEKGQGGLAYNCNTAKLSIADFLSSHDERDVSVHKYDLVAALIKHGCSPDGAGGDKVKPLRCSLKNEDMKMVVLLLREGADPTPISLSSNDTPLHVALSIGMKLKGDFSLLELLFELYAKHPDKYPMLQPSSVDGASNTLFHVIAKGTCSPHAVNAARILLQNKVNPLLRNKDWVTAMQLLKKGNDRRMQYMKQAASYYPDFSPPVSRKKRGKVKENTNQDRATVVQNGDSLGTDDKQNAAPVGQTHHLPSLQKENMSSIAPKVSKEDTKKTIAALISDLPQMEPKRWKEESATKLLSQVSPAKDGEIETRGDDSKIGIDAGEIAVIKEDGVKTNISTDLMDAKLEDEEPQEMDPTIFDDLVWEVECTANVWKLLRDKKLEIRMKRRIIEKIQLLGNGHWRPELCKRLEGTAKNTGMKLYEAKLTKGARILWEIAIAFSPRCSESAEQRLGMGLVREGVVGGRIYSEVIRVWEVVFDHDNVSRTIDVIVKSFSRGQECIIQKKLKGMDRKDFPSNKFTEQRIPMYFHEVDTGEGDAPNSGAQTPRAESATKFFPPASANETEYHIMKFYSFTSALVNNVLLNQDIKVDFPFRVTELEHAIINLNPKPPQSILLLGRSGTGKTTCCLYRLWTSFSRYWQHAALAGEPLIPRSVTFVQQEADNIEANGDDSKVDGENEVSDEETDDSDATSTTGATGDAGASACSTNCQEDCQEDLHCSQEEPIMEHLHQVFVTKNAVLCSEVKRNFRELSHAWEPASEHVEVEDMPLPSCIQDAHPAQFPLFITAKQWLMLLDGSLPNPFFPRCQDGSLKRHMQGWGEKEVSMTYIPDLDDSDGELEDVEDDDEENGVMPGDIENEEFPNQPQPKEFDPRREVTYEVFACELWSKVNKEKIDYHPTLVWMEIMSFIKGSVEALHTEKGELSREVYLELGQKRAPNFCGDRDKVYDMFERYRQIKSTKGLFDECDLVSHIYRRLKDVKALDWSLHQIFVDETQDFTQGELSLFIRCCQDPNSLFLTGDTAQSIMRGVAFRFDDLKTLFHYASKSFKAVGKTSAVAVPKKVYQLTHNYRSHAGILELASSVIDLLMKFFPESFDRLERDQGLFLGPKPVVLQSCSFSDLALLLRGNKRKTSEIEFGAHQVILVANEEAKSNLPEELSLALVLTIYESKGLEFDDVLLYNFFKDSAASKEWRVVTGHLDKLLEQYKYNQERGQENLIELNIAYDDEPVRPRPLDFSPEKHKVLNSELKYLYTALTRARVNIWIFDQDEEKRAPMFEYFVRRNLVDVVETKTGGEEEGLSSAMFASTSTPEEWVRRGDYFYSHKLYQVAAKCYIRGDKKDLEKMSLAQARALSAERLRENPRKLRQEFLMASHDFLQCRMASEAAKCLYNAKEFLLAAKLFEKLAKFRDAGVLFKKAKCHQDAARCYEQASDYKKAIEVLVSVDLFQKAADVHERYDIKVQEYKSLGKMQPQALVNGAPSPLHGMEYLCFEAAKLHFHRREYADMNAALSRLPFERQLQFLKERNNIEGVADLFKRNGQSLEAAKFLKSKGRVEEALKYAERLDDPHFRAECLMISCRKRIQNPFSPLIRESILNDLEEAEKLFSACENRNGQAEALLYIAKLKRDVTILKKSSDLFRASHNVGGEVDIIEVLMEIVPDLFPRHVLPVRDAIETVSNFLIIVQKTPMKLTQTERAMLDLCDLYYGIERWDREQMRRVKTNQAARIGQLLKEDLEGDQLSRNIAYEMICQDLLKKISFCVKRCRAILWGCIKKQELCPDFIAGQPCQELGSCSKLKQEPKRDHLLHHLDNILLLIKLDSTIEWACEQSHKDKSQFEDLRPGEEFSGRFGSCVALYSLLFPPQGHHRNLCAVPLEAREVVVKIRSAFTVEHQLKRWAKHEWTKSPQVQRSNTDVFLMIYNIQRLLRVKTEVLKGMLTKAADDYSAEARQKKSLHKVPKNIGMIRIDRHNGQPIYISLMSRFIDFSKELHIKLDPISAMRSLIRRFIEKLADRATEPLMPSIGNTVWMMELATCLFLSMVAKTTPGVILCLPSGYLAQLSLYDFIRDGEHAMWMTLNRCTWPKQWYTLIANMMVSMIKILCGYRNPRFNVIGDAFQCDKYIKSGEAERALVLLLTLLCNTNQALPLDCESLLRKSLLTIPLSRDSMPQRLYMIVKSAKEASGLQAIIGVLRDVLKYRDQYLYQCSWGTIGRKPSNAMGLVHGPVDVSSFCPAYSMPLADVQAADSSYSSSGMETQSYGEDHDEFNEQEALDAEKSAKLFETQRQLFTCVLVLKACQRFKQLTQARPQVTSASAEDNTVPDLLQHIMLDDNMCGYCGVHFSLSSATTAPDWEKSERNQATSQTRPISPFATDAITSPGTSSAQSLMHHTQSQSSWDSSMQSTFKHSPPPPSLHQTQSPLSWENSMQSTSTLPHSPSSFHQYQSQLSRDNGMQCTSTLSPPPPSMHQTQRQLSWDSTMQAMYVDPMEHQIVGAQDPHQMISDPKQEQTKQREKHQQSSGHREKMQYFKIFSKMYYQQILPVERKCEDFRQKLPHEGANNAEALHFKLHELANDIMNLQALVNSTIQKKTWGNTQEINDLSRKIEKLLGQGEKCLTEWQGEVDAEQHKLAVAQERQEELDEGMLFAHDDSEEQVGPLLRVTEGPDKQKQMKERKGRGRRRLKQNKHH